MTSKQKLRSVSWKKIQRREEVGQGEGWEDASNPRRSTEGPCGNEASAREHRG